MLQLINRTSDCFSLSLLQLFDHNITATNIISKLESRACTELFASPQSGDDLWDKVSATEWFYAGDYKYILLSQESNTESVCDWLESLNFIKREFKQDHIAWYINTVAINKAIKGRKVYSFDLKSNQPNPIIFNRVFVDIAGGVAESLFLSYLYQLSQQSPNTYIPIPFVQFEENIGLSRRQYEKAKSNLEAKNFLVIKRNGVDPTLSFLLNLEQLESLM